MFGQSELGWGAPMHGIFAMLPERLVGILLVVLGRLFLRQPIAKLPTSNAAAKIVFS
jgi:hypothetical protein